MLILHGQEVTRDGEEEEREEGEHEMDFKLLLDKGEETNQRVT